MTSHTPDTSQHDDFDNHVGQFNQPQDHGKELLDNFCDVREMLDQLQKQIYDNQHNFQLETIKQVIEEVNPKKRKEMIDGLLSNKTNKALIKKNIPKKVIYRIQGNKIYVTPKDKKKGTNVLIFDLSYDVKSKKYHATPESIETKKTIEQKVAAVYDKYADRIAQKAESITKKMADGLIYESSGSQPRPSQDNSMSSISNFDLYSYVDGNTVYVMQEKAVLGIFCSSPKYDLQKRAYISDTYDAFDYNIFSYKNPNEKGIFNNAVAVDQHKASMIDKISKFIQPEDLQKLQKEGELRGFGSNLKISDFQRRVDGDVMCAVLPDGDRYQNIVSGKKIAPYVVLGIYKIDSVNCVHSLKPDPTFSVPLPLPTQPPSTPGQQPGIDSNPKLPPPLPTQPPSAPGQQAPRRGNGGYFPEYGEGLG